MKKLKVILPAILTLAVSTSAAVTGTVAWFTASRLQTVSMAAFSAVNPEAGLNLLGAKNIGNTTISNTTGEHGKITTVGDPVAVTHVSGGYLRDASVDLTQNTPVVYGTVLNDDGSIKEFASKGFAADTKKYANKNVYFATAFTLTFGASTLNDTEYETSLFFDFGLSSATKPTDTTPVTQDENDLYNSVRFGFKTSDRWFVWAPLTTEAYDGEDSLQAQYVNGTAKNAFGTYDANHFIKGNADAGNTTVPDDSENVIEAANKVGAKGYLGQLTQGTAATESADATGLSVTVYTWFEGTDDDCENINFKNNVLQLTASLSFVMRRTQKAA